MPTPCDTSRHHFDPDAECVELTVRNNLVAAKQPEQEILRKVQECGYREEDVFAIKLALEEAMTNAVRHGNRNDPAKQIFVRYQVTPRKTTILIRDEGPGFRPERVPDPTAPEFIERPCGRGIMLMRVYMTHVAFGGQGNEVILVKVNEP